MEDLHLLPKVRDGLSYVYVEHARVDQHEKSVAYWDESGYTALPIAALCVLMLGPGSSITHAAIRLLAEHNCLVAWCGEENVRFYAFGTGGTRRAAPLLLQARLVSDPALRLEVVQRMYRIRFREAPPAGDLTIEQLRGLEGARMRRIYAEWSAKTGVEWTGRVYDRTNWAEADPVNRALSCANSCLYSICHAATLAAGYSPGLGFIHTGKQLSFIYDLADLYKAEFSIPVAFRVAGEGPLQIERRTRMACRDRFRETKLLARLIPDIQALFGVKDDPAFDPIGFDGLDLEKALPGGLWGPEEEGGIAEGGVNYAPLPDEEVAIAVAERTGV
jgi:CRISP-associated protein Cas1